jgi:hypothetical protein
MATTQPSSHLLAATKGIAIAASFITTGSLLTNSTSIIPIVLHSGSSDDSSAAQTAAQQFALAHRAGKKILPPAEILSTLAFGFLAYHSHQTARLSPSSTWKLYAGAAAAMFSVISYTLALMEQASLKLVQLADAPPHHADSNPSLSHKPQNGGGLLSVPGQSAVERPAITTRRLARRSMRRRRCRRCLGSGTHGTLLGSLGRSLLACLGCGLRWLSSCGEVRSVGRSRRLRCNSSRHGQM